MTTSLYPAIVDALVSIMSPLESVQVYDGWAVTQDYNNNLLIGVADPDDTNVQEVGSESQSWHGTGSIMQTRDDDGAVWCTALAWAGNNTAKTARDAVKAILAVVETQIRTDPTLGSIPGLLWAEACGEAIWRQGQGKGGVRVACSFTINYRGLI